MINRKMTLESRIARLEKLLTGRKSVKNEGLTNNQYDMVSKAVWDFANRFSDPEDRIDALQDLLELDASAVNSVLNILEDRYMSTREVVVNLDSVKKAIADEADEILADAGAWDDDDYEFDESRSRRCESRRRLARR
jgi:hypothetical protein